MTIFPRSYLLALSFLIVFVALAHPEAATAQHSWQHTEICEDCVPVNSYFRDSLAGIVMVKNASAFLPVYRFFSTEDGGRSWAQGPWLGMQKDRYHDLAMDAQGDIFHVNIAGNPLLMIAMPDSNHWEIASLIYVLYDMKWQDALHGIGVGREEFLGGINLMLTDDGGEHWYSLREDRYAEGYTVTDARLIEGGMVVSYQKADTILVEQTIDSGRTWTSQVAYANDVGQRAFAGPISLSASPSRFYLITQKRDTLDYISSTNGGESWQQHNVTGGRMHRIYEPSPNNLWAIVGRTYSNTLPHLPSLLGSKNGHVYMADTLYYSTNSGATWEKDLSFANDTIADMHWPDAQHGFVVSYRDNRVKVSRLAPQLAVRKAMESEEMRVWPNPSSDRIFAIQGISGLCTIEITDVDGRMIRNEHTALGAGETQRIKLSPELPSGVYYLQVRSTTRSYNAKFIVK